MAASIINNADLPVLGKWRLSVGLSSCEGENCLIDPNSLVCWNQWRAKEDEWGFGVEVAHCGFVVVVVVFTSNFCIRCCSLSSSSLSSSDPDKLSMDSSSSSLSNCCSVTGGKSLSFRFRL